MKNNNDNFLIALACSIALHLAILYIFLFGLPAWFYPSTPEEQVITFEMLPISSIANIPNQQKQIEKPVEREEAKKVQQAKLEPAEEKKIIEKTQEEEKPKPEPEKPKPAEQPKEQEAEVVKIEKKTEPKPIKEVETPKPIKAKEEPKKPEKPKEKKKKILDNNDLDSLLKNLEKSSEGKSDKSDKRSQKQGNAERLSKGSYNENQQLSNNIQNIIRQQLQKFWSPPIGSQNLENATISVHLILDKNGNVLEVLIIGKHCQGILESTCQALAESVERAIWQASPIQNLPVEFYNMWKEIKSNFSPKDLN